MNVNDFNRQKYDLMWRELAHELKNIENEQSLVEALDTLHQQQRDQGFIRDDLESMERYHFYHSERPELHFSVQYNPVRLERFKGAGRTIPPPGQAAVNAGYFLCRENIRWQQRGIELGYEVNVNDTVYYALMNAYPLMPVHMVFASRQHLPQSWRTSSSMTEHMQVEKILYDLVTLSTRLPGYIGFYNGEGAGASIPGHFHFQFLKRPSQDMPLPLEVAATLPRPDGLHIISDYPITSMHWQGAPEETVKAATDWMQSWMAENSAHENRLSANIIAVTDQTGQKVALYVVPRDQMRVKSPEMVGIVGGLEILGELVFSSEEEKQKLDRGEIDYHTVERILASIQPAY